MCFLSVASIVLLSCKRKGTSTSPQAEEVSLPSSPILFLSEEQFQKLRGEPFISLSGTSGSATSSVENITSSMEKGRKLIGGVLNPRLPSARAAMATQQRDDAYPMYKYTFEIGGKEFELLDGILPGEELSPFHYDEFLFRWSEAFKYATDKGEVIQVRGSTRSMATPGSAILYQQAPYYGVLAPGEVFVSKKGYVVSMPQDCWQHPVTHMLVVDLGEGQLRMLDVIDSLEQRGLAVLSDGLITKAISPHQIYHVKGMEHACIVEYKKKLEPGNPDRTQSASSYLFVRWK